MPPAPPPAPSFDLLLQAMNDPRRERIAATFTPDATIDRYTAGDEGALRERFTGLDDIEAWLRLTPSRYKFGLAGETRPSAAAPDDDNAAAPDDDGSTATWAIEYSIRSDDFENGGHWHARFDAEGRICWLRHHPFALRHEH